MEESQKEVIVNLPDTVVGAKLFLLDLYPSISFYYGRFSSKKYKIME